VIKDLTAYLTRHTTSPAFAPLQTLLAPSSPAQIGLIISERFVNMAHQVVPPMYTMLLEEIQWALEDKEPYAFTHYLVLSKTYVEVASTIPQADQPPSKKKKAGAKEGEGEVFYFHPEDEVLHKHASAWGTFEYETPVDDGASDSKRAFQELGVKPKGHLILIEAEKFQAAVEGVKSFLGGE
jgi:protein BCP1